MDAESRSCWKSTIDLYNVLKHHLSQLSDSDLDLFLRSTLQEVDDPLWIVLKAMSSLYVTDRSTGFVYTNLDVFVCHATPSCVPCVWKLYTITSPEPMAFVREHSDKEFYFSSSHISVEDTKTERCLSTVIDDCDGNSQFYTHFLNEKCKSFTSLVQMTTAPFFRFRNRFCLLCFRGETDYKAVYVSLKARDKIPLSSVLVGFEKDGISLTPKILSQPEKQTWAHAWCQVSPDIPCDVTKCNSGFVKRRDGKCRTHYTLYMAVHLRHTTPSHVTHRKLAQLMRCLATKHLGWDMGSETKIKLTSFTLGTNFLYGVGIGIYSSGFELDWMDVEKFALRYGNAFLQLINLLEMSTDILEARFYEYHMIEVFLETKFNDVLFYSTDYNMTSITETSPAGQLPFCAGVDFKKRGGNFSLTCYPPKDKQVAQLHNDSCLVEYNTAAAVGYVNVEYINLCSFTLVMVTMIITH